MKRNRIFSFVLVLCLLALPLSLALAQPGAGLARIYCKHFIFGYPLGAPASNPMVIRDLYALSLNGQTKFADWVCYYLTPKETHGPPGLPRNWQNDPWLKKGEALEVSPRMITMGLRKRKSTGAIWPPWHPWQAPPFSDR